MEQTTLLKNLDYQNLEKTFKSGEITKAKY